MLSSTGSQSIRHDLAAEQHWSLVFTSVIVKLKFNSFFCCLSYFFFWLNFLFFSQWSPFLHQLSDVGTSAPECVSYCCIAHMEFGVGGLMGGGSGVKQKSFIIIHISVN